MSLDTLQNEYRTLAVKAHEVVTDPDLTSAEKREKYEAMDADLKALSDKIADEKFLDDRRKELAPVLGGDPAGDRQPDEPKAESRSPGRQLVESDGYKAVVESIKAGGRFESGAIQIKAALTETGLTSGNVIQQDRQPGILPILFERLTVADLMPNGTTTSNTVRYVKESTATNAASTVAETGTKPASALNFTVVDEPVKKIATVMKTSTEMLEDFAQAESYINGRLVLFVRLREEQQLLTGNTSTGANDLVGLLNRSGLTAAQAKAGDSIAVAVHKEVTKVRVASFLDPDALVFHPNDWEAARLEQDANQQFYGGGPFTGPYGVNGIVGDTYWGLRVVSTTAMTENTVLLGAFRTGAQVFRRSGITVDMTNSNEDDFLTNLVAIRAEERLALAVYRPSAFGTVTGV